MEWVGVEVFRVRQEPPHSLDLNLTLLTLTSAPSQGSLATTDALRHASVSAVCTISYVPRLFLSLSLPTSLILDPIRIMYVSCCSVPFRCSECPESRTKPERFQPAATDTTPITSHHTQTSRCGGFCPSRPAPPIQRAPQENSINIFPYCFSPGDPSLADGTHVRAHQHTDAIKPSNHRDSHHQMHLHRTHAAHTPYTTT